MWYFIEDKEYLKLEKLKKLGNPEIVLSYEDLNRKIEKILKEDKSVISPLLPPENLKNLFVVKELPNLHSPFTTEEWEYLQSIDEKERKKEEEKILGEKLGLKIHKPALKLSELGGMKNLKRYVEYIKVLEKVKDIDLEVKGIFLVGIAGTGKSYSVKTVAGELNRHLVELNLSKIMENPNPIFTLHKVFQFLEKLSLQNKNMKFILWIDEIEKMFASLDALEKKVLGQLLTILNDLNTPEGYKINAFFWATANDLHQIIEKNPEFLRSGRFDKLFFVDTPCYPNEAIDIFKIYFKKFNLPIPTDNDFFVELVSLAQNIIWEKLVKDYGDIKVKTFIYTPAEIMQTVKEVKRDILLFADKFNKLSRTFNKDITEIQAFLEILASYTLDLNKFDQLLKKRLGENHLFYKKIIDFYRKITVSVKTEWEKILLAFFYTEFHNVSPLLKTARNTITKLRGLKEEHFLPVSDCESTYFEFQN